MWILGFSEARWIRAVALEGIRAPAKMIVFGRRESCSTNSRPRPRLAPEMNHDCEDIGLSVDDGVIVWLDDEMMMD